MTTTTFTPSPSTASRRSWRGPLLVSIALVLAIALAVVVLVSQAITTSSSKGGGSGGQDNSYCRPTLVAHHC